MRGSARALVLLVGLWCIAAPVRAAPTDNVDTKSEVDGADQTAKTKKQLVRSEVEAQLRFRGSYASHISELQADQEDLVRGIFQRVRLGTHFEMAALDATIQLQSASMLGEAGPVQHQPPGAAPSGPGDVPVPIGLQQGRLRWRPSWLSGAEVELGRMALQYGKGRQIGRYDFHETGNAFDGLRLHYGIPKYLDVDLLAVKLRRNTAHSELERNMLGVYVAGKPSNSLEADVYFLFIKDGAEDLRLDLQTMGARVQWHPWKWLELEAEGAFQVGTQQPEGMVEPLDHFATSVTLAASASYNPGVPLAVGVQLQQHSGNTGESDDQIRAWRPLYPNLNEHLGLLQIVDQRNLMQTHGWLRIGHEEGAALIIDLRMNRSVNGSPVPAFSEPKLTGEEGQWAALGTEINTRLRWPVFGSSELLIATGVFAPSEALGAKIGRAWARQYLAQWNTTF